MTPAQNLHHDRIVGATMAHHPNRPVIALDADGVLLDYSLAYATAWAKAFGTYPKERDPHAYWPPERWEVERLSGSRLEQFRSAFDEDFWSNLPAIDGAISACTLLVQHGYELVCVSAIHSAFAHARLKNLQNLGFPIDRLITATNSHARHSPKADALHPLMPIAFVDDYLPYHLGVDDRIHKALILRARNGTPNVGSDLRQVHSTHGSLADFATWWIS